MRNFSSIFLRAALPKSAPWGQGQQQYPFQPSFASTNTCFSCHAVENSTCPCTEKCCIIIYIYQPPPEAFLHLPTCSMLAQPPGCRGWSLACQHQGIHEIEQGPAVQHVYERDELLWILPLSSLRTRISSGSLCQVHLAFKSWCID